jgi:hypothetical protein
LFESPKKYLSEDAVEAALAAVANPAILDVDALGPPLADALACWACESAAEVRDSNTASVRNIRAEWSSNGCEFEGGGVRSRELVAPVSWGM